MTDSCGLWEAPAETATAEWDHFLLKRSGNWRPAAKIYNQHESIWDIQTSLKLLLTGVTSEDSRWYHSSAQICLVAYIFFEAPVWLWESEDTFRHGVLCHWLCILECSAPRQRAHNVRAVTVGNLHFRVCLYRNTTVQTQDKGRLMRTSLGGHIGLQSMHFYSLSELLCEESPAINPFWGITQISEA